MKAVTAISLLLWSWAAWSQSPYRIVSAQALPYTDPTYFHVSPETATIALQYQGQYQANKSSLYKTLGLFSNYLVPISESDAIGLQFNVLTENDLSGYQLLQIVGGISYRKQLSQPRSTFQHSAVVGLQVGLNNFRLNFEELWFSSQFDQSVTQVQLNWDSGEPYLTSGNFNDTYWPINGGVQYHISQRNRWELMMLFTINQFNEPVANIDVANFKVNRSYLGHLESAIHLSSEFGARLWSTYGSQANSNILQAGVQAIFESNSNGQDWKLGIGGFSNITSLMATGSLVQLGAALDVEWMSVGLHFRYLQPLNQSYNLGSSFQIGLSYFPVK